MLIVRAFIFEPFRIPSDSMMPTLLDGDFIVVNKYAYGLRLPVLNEKFLDTGTPQRGDVVVFRYPPNPSVNYIKRLVGLPGDRIEVRDDHLVINGETIQLRRSGPLHRRLLSRHASGHRDDRRAHPQGHVVPLAVRVSPAHDLLSAGAPRPHYRSAIASGSANPPTVATCAMSPARRVSATRTIHFDMYSCNGVVPAGHYLMIGDNRDNSEDSRSWGLVPDKNLVGKATRIWFNFDLQRSSVVNWSRIGDGIRVNRHWECICVNNVV